MARPRVIHFHFRPRHNVGDAAVLQAIRELLEDPLRRPRWTSRLIKDLRRRPRNALLAEINRHDLVVLGGGGLFSRWGLPLDPDLIAGIRPPMVIFGAGLNRNDGDDPLDDGQRASAAALGRQAAAVSVRDEATREFLAALAVPATLTGDPALFLRGRRPWFLGLPGTFRVGVNLAAHGWTLQSRYLDRAIAAFEPVLAGLAGEPGAQLFYLRHTDREESVARQLRARFPGLRICRQGPAGLRYVYGQMDLVVSMMLHSAIFAAGSGKPVVNVAYDDKSRAFLADLGKPGWSIPVTEVSAARLQAAVEEARATRGTDPFGPALRRYRQAMDPFIQKVAALLPP